MSDWTEDHWSLWFCVDLTEYRTFSAIILARSITFIFLTFWAFFIGAFFTFFRLAFEASFLTRPRACRRFNCSVIRSLTDLKRFTNRNTHISAPQGPIKKRKSQASLPPISAEALLACCEMLLLSMSIGWVKAFGIVNLRILSKDCSKFCSLWDFAWRTWFYFSHNDFVWTHFAGLTAIKKNCQKKPKFFKNTDGVIVFPMGNCTSWRALKAHFRPTPLCSNHPHWTCRRLPNPQTRS